MAVFIWQADINRDYHSIYMADGRTFRGVVEAVPSAGWDWLVWDQDNPDRKRHGTAATASAAMIAADGALSALSSSMAS